MADVSISDIELLASIKHQLGLAKDASAEDTLAKVREVMANDHLYRQLRKPSKIQEAMHRKDRLW